MQRWPLGPNGLLLDREWALVDPEGSALTQKGLPALASINPRLDLAAGKPALYQLLEIPLMPGCC